MLLYKKSSLMLNLKSYGQNLKTLAILMIVPKKIKAVVGPIQSLLLYTTDDEDCTTASLTLLSYTPCPRQHQMAFFHVFYLAWPSITSPVFCCGSIQFLKVPWLSFVFFLPCGSNSTCSHSHLPDGTCCKLSTELRPCQPGVHSSPS